MSRFFAVNSESESDTEVSEDEIPLKAQPVPTYVVSDEEEDEKRVVKSAKEKRYEEMQETIRQMRNHKKIKDVTNVLKSFEELMPAYNKALPVIQKEDHGVTPIFFLRALAELEDFVNDLWDLGNEYRKNSMSKNNAKSLATLRQKLKKALNEFEGDLQKFREAVDLEDEEPEQAKAESEDEEIEVAAVKEPKAKVKPAKLEDEDSESDYWPSKSDSEDAVSSEEDETKYINIREKYLKKTTQEEEERKKREKKEKKDKEKEKKKLKQQEEAHEELEGQGDWEVVRGGVPMPTKPKMFDKNTEITVESVLKKLNEIVSARGKKGTNKAEMVDMLQELLEIAEANNLGPGVSVKVRLSLVAAIFDYSTKVSDAMKVEHWDKLLITVDQLIKMLDKHDDITLTEQITEENEQFGSSPYRIRGCILTVVERLDAEFIKILKDLDCHSNEYVIRLSDENRVIKLIDDVTSYVEKQHEKSADICRAYILKMDHIYYKIDMKALDETTKEPTSLNTMDRLCKFICGKDNTDRLRQRAVLYQIYHLSLHNRWFAARNLMLMSHLQETIQHSDPPTQILYNRTMVQLGMCAFRYGSIKDAHNALLDIQSGGRAKELLAQGLLMTRQMDRTQEQEKLEKQRQVPFHMQINLELLECVYLVSAMLIEIPYMAAYESDARRRMISKSFHHQLKMSERQAVIGPPESMREHVVAAAKAMRNGNWEACKNYLINDKMNTKVWSLFKQGDVRPTLIRKIQEETMRTYLFTFSKVYDSFSVRRLSQMFQLELRDVHSIVSKMIIREELMASLDEPTQSVVMHRTEPSRLQSYSLQLADRLLSLVENNERIPEIKQGGRVPMQQGYRDRPYQRREDGKGGAWPGRGDRERTRRGVYAE